MSILKVDMRISNAAKNPLDLSEKQILVTGASSGIGKATSVILSRLGARIILVGRNAERLHAAHSELENSNHIIEPFDLSRIDAISGWMKSMANRHGVLHGVVHCAGVQQTLPARSIRLVDMESLFQINVYAAIALLKGFRQRDVHSPQASAVLISSVMGLVGEACCITYSASKGAIISLTKSAAIELARDGLRVNCIASGFVKTPMYESLAETLTQAQIMNIEGKHILGIGTAEDIANTVAFLISDASIWITGTTVVVDGGYTAS